MRTLAESFIPDKVFDCVIDGHENRKQRQHQCKYREFPFYDLIQLDPAEHPNQYDGNHLKGKAGIPGVIT
jgi:hypothetical protein